MELATTPRIRLGFDAQNQRGGTKCRDSTTVPVRGSVSGDDGTAACAPVTATGHRETSAAVSPQIHPGIASASPWNRYSSRLCLNRLGGGGDEKKKWKRRRQRREKRLCAVKQGRWRSCVREGGRQFHHTASLATARCGSCRRPFRRALYHPHTSLRLRGTEIAGEFL